MNEKAKKILINGGKGVSHNRLLNAACLYRLHEKYINERPEPPSEPAEFGALVHRLVESSFKKGADPSELVDALLPEYPLVPRKRAGEAVVLARNGLAKIPETDVELEVEFVKPFHAVGGIIINFQGRVDRVEYDPWNTRVVDLKTGSPYPAEGDRQLCLYAWGLDLEECEGVLHFVRSDTWDSMTITEESINSALDWARSQVDKVYRACLEDCWPASECSRCRYCGYRETCPVQPEAPEGIEEAREAAKKALYHEDEAKKYKNLVKDFVTRTGTAVDVEEKVFGFTTSTSLVGEIEKVLEKARKKGWPLDEILSISSKAKKYLEDGLKDVVIEKVNSRFTVQKKK